MKLSVFAAQQVVDAWKADALWGSVQHLFPEIKFYKPMYRIRPLIAANNVQANHALWDGNYGAATGWLMKFGIAKRNAFANHATQDKGFGASLCT